MNKRIIYQNEDGGVSILIPCECGLTIGEIADKAVPTGLPYKIVDIADVPSDRDLRNEWTVDAVELTDGVGA